MPRSAKETANFERPYSPGWFDRLTDWIDRMPGPNSLYCFGLLARVYRADFASTCARYGIVPISV